MADEISTSSPTFDDINDRLKVILAEVDDEELPLDDALNLFEEAVTLGMQASSLLEVGIAADAAAADEAAVSAMADEDLPAIEESASPAEGVYE